MAERIEEKILKLLKKKKEQNILEIATALEMDRHTIAKYLEILKTKGLILYSEKGKSKQWKLNNNAFTELLGTNEFISKQVLEMLSILDYEASIQSRNYDVIWNNRSKKNGKCYEIIKGQKTKCKNCPSEQVFRTGQPQKTIIKNKETETILITQPIKNEQGEVIAVVELTKGVK